MDKRFFTAWAVLFVVWMLGSFLVHGAFLHADYAMLPNLFRSESDTQQFFPLMLLAHVSMAGAFAWLYPKGAEAKPWLGQGVRFGFAVALLAIVPTYAMYFVVQPMPGTLAIKQIAGDGLLLIVLGAVVAWLYRGGATGRPV